MSKRRFGMKEVANVVFFDILTGKPVAFFDTLKVSTIENEAETADAMGGQGNPKLISWDYNRTANVSISDALLSETTLKMLAGQQEDIEEAVIVMHEKLTVDGTNISLKEDPDANSFTIYKNENGVLGEEVTGATNLAGVLDVSAATPSVADGEGVFVFYEVTKSTGVNQVVFAGNKFPSTYRVVGSTLVRDENGTDHLAQFEIPKAKMQASFSLTMDVENVATFDFSLEVLVDKDKQDQLYKITRIDS